MKFFDLFSGIGGFTLGLERAGHECVGACEWNEHARRVYSHHWPQEKIWNDATKLDPKELPDFELLTAGFPCQAFSVAGKRLGFEESRGTVFYEIARIAREKRPRLLLLENVKGLLSHDEGRTFAQILYTLDELGYDAQWSLLNSKWWVPQNRNRIYIVGHLRDGPRPQVFPVGDGSQKPSKALGAPQGKGERLDDQIANTVDATYYKGRRQMVVEPKIKKLIDGREAERVYDTDGISSTVKSSGGGQGGKSGLYYMSHTVGNIKQRYQKRDTSWTLDTSGSKMAVDDTKRIRKLTPLECERLQGFPDNHTNVEGLSDTQRYRCIGNAVTVPVVEFIGRMLK